MCVCVVRVFEHLAKLLWFINQVSRELVARVNLENEIGKIPSTGRYTIGYNEGKVNSLKSELADG